MMMIKDWLKEQMADATKWPRDMIYVHQERLATLFHKYDDLKDTVDQLEDQIDQLEDFGKPQVPAPDNRGAVWNNKDHQQLVDAFSVFCDKKAKELGRTSFAIKCRVQNRVGGKYYL